MTTETQKQIEHLESENMALRRFSALYEDAIVERDRYKGLIIKAFEYASPLSKKGKIYRLALSFFERENNL